MSTKKKKSLQTIVILLILALGLAVGANLLGVSTAEVKEIFGTLQLIEIQF